MRGRESGSRRKKKSLEKLQIHQLYSSPFSMTPLPNYGYKGNKKHLHLHVKGFRDSDYVSRKPKSSDFKGYLTSIQMATKGWLSGLRAPARADWGWRGGEGGWVEGKWGGRRWWWGLLGSQTSFVLPLYFGLSLYSLRSCYFLTTITTPPPSSTVREGLWDLGCFVRLSTVLRA